MLLVLLYQEEGRRRGGRFDLIIADAAAEVGRFPLSIADVAGAERFALSIADAAGAQSIRVERC